MDDGKTLPFDRIIECNIGNPQALGQKPMTFPRQVLALVNVPGLVNSPEIHKLFPQDAITRAKEYIAAMPGGTGAYSHSKGIPIARKDVAIFLEKRDGMAADIEDIFLTDGASQGVQTILKALIRNEDDGILVPIPQYPLYSAGIALNGGTLLEYHLEESERWGMNVAVLKKTVEAARAKGISPRACVIINPGNPTGQCLSRENMQEIVTFCEEEELLIMADEVYQENVYASDREFVSFRKVVKEMQSNAELVSFHSTSKGFFGECGRRGGYMHLEGICDSAKEQLYKLASVSLCANIEGQLMVAMMSNPPAPGDQSFELYVQERDDILMSLHRRAIKLVAAFNTLEGVTCVRIYSIAYYFSD